MTMMVTRQTDRFGARPDRDSDTLKVMPSVRLEAPAIVQGSLGVGYRRFDGRTAELPDFTGIVYEGNLSHIIADRTKVDVGLSRDVQYSFEILEPYYVINGLRLTLSHQLRDTIDVRAMASRDRLDYHAQSGDAVSRRDRVEVISGGGGYRIRPNVRIGFDLEYTRRLSERADRRYDRTRMLGSASYGF
jgi:hypothetical protein